MFDGNITVEEIDKLEEVNNMQNQGRGIQCVKGIISTLRIGNFDMAQRIRQWDGDKTRSYPEVEKVLTKLFGCRLHGKIDCDNSLCKQYYETIIN